MVEEKPRVESTNTTNTTIEVNFDLYDYRVLKCETNIELKHSDYIQISRLRKVNNLVFSWHLNDRISHSSVSTYTFTQPIETGIYICTVHVSDSANHYYLLIRNGKTRRLSNTSDLVTKFHFYSYDKLADEDDDEITTTTTKSTSVTDNDVKVTTEWTRSLDEDELNTVGELITTRSSSDRKPTKRQRLTATGRSISGSNLAPPVESGGVTTDSSDETIESTSDEEEVNENHSTHQTTNEPFKETTEWTRNLSSEESQTIQTTLTGEDETTAEIEITSTQSEFTTNNDYSTHQDASIQETSQQQDDTTSDSSTQEAIQQHDTTADSSTHEVTTLSKSDHKDDDDNDEEDEDDEDKEKLIIAPSTPDHNHEEVTTAASPSKDHEISLEFTYRRDRNIISLNCTETNGILLENIEIRKNNGRVIASIESSSNLQIKVRKWQLNDDETLYCLAHDGYTFKEQSLHIDI